MRLDDWVFSEAMHPTVKAAPHITKAGRAGLKAVTFQPVDVANALPAPATQPPPGFGRARPSERALAWEKPKVDRTT